MKKQLKYLIWGLIIVSFIGLPYICVKIAFGGISGGGSSSGTPEGTAVLSTGEAGGTKYLREDGDGTSSWQAATGAGDLLADGTVPLTANWDVGNFSITTRDLIADYGVAGATMNITGLATAGTIQTGQGATEVYLMDQAVQTTNAVTFAGLTLTYGLNAATMTLTGSGQSSLNAGLIVNEDGGATDATDGFRVESNTEANMIIVTPSSDVMYLGGSTNGVKFAKAGAMDFIGSAAGNEIGGLLWEKNFTVTSPSNTYIVAGSSIPIVSKLSKAVTVTSVFVCLDSDPTTEISADLKSVTNPSGWTSPIVINSLSTDSGQLTDTSITAGNVDAGTCIYLNLHAQPDVLSKFMGVTISGYYQ